MKNSLKSALLQRNWSGLAKGGRAPRHARRAVSQPGRIRGARVAGLAVVLAVTAATIGGATYLVTQLTGSPRQHPSAQVPPASRRSTPTAPHASVASPVPAGSPGDYQVAERWFTFTEASATLGTRTLLVDVRFPDTPPVGAASPSAGSRSFPLVVFAPGYGQCSGSYSDLLSEWASAGYVVAAVNFPQTNCNTANPNESDLVNQPGDLAFVIGRLVTMSGEGQAPLAGLIDATRVAVAGHSDGGDTVAAMAAMSCCQYPALRAVIVLAGAEWPAFAGRWFGAPTPPMLFAQASADTVNPPAATLQLYQADSTGVRFYLNLLGSDHLAPYEGDGSPEPIVEQVTIDFLDQYLAGRGNNTSAMQSAGNVAGVAQLVDSGTPP
jgi:dienelactone hydrolase